jgi:hypothetical protein
VGQGLWEEEEQLGVVFNETLFLEYIEASAQIINIALSINYPVTPLLTTKWAQKQNSALVPFPHCF